MKMFPFGIASRGSFRRQIILVFVIGFFFLIGPFSLYMVQNESSYLHRDSREDTATLAELLATGSRSWVMANDIVGLQEVVHSLLSHPQLRYAMVISPSGRVLAHTDETKVGQFVSDERSLALLKSPPAKQVMIDSESLEDVAMPIMIRDQHIGWARVEQSREKENGNLRKMVWSSALFVLLATTLSLIAALLIARQLGGRIGSLVHAAEEVQSGNFDMRVNIPLNQDEISKLAESFNRMLDALAQNKEELRAASLYTRSLIEANLDPLVTISPEGKITDVNEATVNATGMRRKELVGTDFSSYFTEPDKARAGYQKVFLLGSVVDYPLTLRHKDGRIMDVLYNASVYRKGSGEVLGVFAAARDITERKQAEEKLRRSEEVLKEAQRIAHLGSWHMNLATNEVFWSEELYKMYGFDPALPPPLYTESMKLFTPESWEKLSAAITQAGVADTPYELELEMVPKDGSRRWMWARGEPVRDARGATVGVRGVTMDITERKQAEEQLRRSEHGLAEAQRMAHLGNWNLDLVNNVLTWSDEIYRIFEIAPEKFGASYDAFLNGIHPDDRDMVNNAYTESVKNRKPYNIVHRLLMKDGRVKYVNEKGETNYGEDGKPLLSVGMVHDITAQKVAEIELTALKDDLENQVRARTSELEDANKELESFSYSVSHDLRTPLRAIDGFSNILLEDYAATLDDEGKRLLNVVRDNSKKMAQLIDDILKFSRAGRTEIAYAEIDMEGLAREVYAELQPTAGHELKVEIGHLPKTRGDRAMMRQVLVNLLSNAIKYSRKKASAMITVGASVAGNEVVYFVQDNGAGFDMQYADRLFGVFQRLHTAEEFEGTGIGLAICKRIITRHGGRVWAEGKLNEGATLYFALPLVENRA